MTKLSVICIAMAKHSKCALASVRSIIYAAAVWHTVDRVRCRLCIDCVLINYLHLLLLLTNISIILLQHKRLAI